MSSLGSTAGLVICGLMPYMALAVFAWGLVSRILKWSGTPQSYRVFFASGP